MFLTAAGFKKLITSAYKGAGLHVANDGEGYIFFGLVWKMWIRKGMIPKKSLGDLIALVGELPEKGECFVATKEETQYEAFAALPETAMELANSCNTEVEPTRVLLVSSEVVRLFQNESQPVVAVSEKLYSLIQPTAADQEEEGPLIGPKVKIFEMGYNPSVGMCWRNDQMAVSFLFGETNQVEKEITILESYRIARTSEKI